MELYDIASRAFNPIAPSVLTGFNQGQQARTAQMQNASSALQLQRDQALQAIAPQLGQAFANSGMPLGETWGQLVQANPALAQTGLREAMDFEQDKLRRQQLMILAKPEVQAVLQNIRDDILTLQQVQRDVTRGLNRDQVVEQAALYQAAENELLFAKQELAKHGANASMIDQNVPKFTPYATLFKDILSAEQQVEAGKRAQTQLDMNQELFPYQKQNLIADTQMKLKTAGEKDQQIASTAQNDLQSFKNNNGTAIKDASDSIIALNKLRTLKALADGGNLPAKQAIVFLNARGVSGPGVLTESDVSNTSGTSMVQDLAQKFRLKDQGTASNYSTIYPNAEKTFISEINSRKSQLQSAVEQYNASRLDPSQKITVESLLPKQQLLPIGSGGGQTKTAPKAPAPSGQKFDFSKFKK